jgi:hypothetical protein
MTNQNVLDMVYNKVPAVTIVDAIRAASKTNFDLSPAGLIQLTNGGVSSQIVGVMRNPKPSAAAVSPSAPAPAPVTIPPVQSAPATAAPAPIHTETVVVPDGKPFNITLAQDVPAKLTAGQKINFTVSNDVAVGGVVVIAKGTPVTGEIVAPGDTKKVALVLNKQGHATFKLTSVESLGGKLTIRATATHGDKKDRQIELVGNKSKEILAPTGTEYLSYVDNEQPVTIKH